MESPNLPSIHDTGLYLGPIEICKSVQPFLLYSLEDDVAPDPSWATIREANNSTQASLRYVLMIGDRSHTNLANMLEAYSNLTPRTIVGGGFVLRDATLAGDTSSQGKAAAPPAIYIPYQDSSKYQNQLNQATIKAGQGTILPVPKINVNKDTMYRIPDHVSTLVRDHWLQYREVAAAHPVDATHSQ